MKICPMRSDLLYVGWKDRQTDGHHEFKSSFSDKQTDITNLRVAFGSLLNEPEK